MVQHDIESIDASEQSKKLAKFLLQNLSGLPPFDKITGGYWPIVSFHWIDAKVEVEVHDDSFEFYDFSKPAADILEFAVDDMATLVALLTTRLAPS